MKRTLKILNTEAAEAGNGEWVESLCFAILNHCTFSITTPGGFGETRPTGRDAHIRQTAGLLAKQVTRAVRFRGNTPYRMGTLGGIVDPNEREKIWLEDAKLELSATSPLSTQSLRV